MLSFLIAGIENYFEFRAIRGMNNAVRRDIAATMARKDYKELHNLDMGAYISQFSNNIERIESLAWNPFFGFSVSIKNRLLREISTRIMLGCDRVIRSLQSWVVRHLPTD